MPSVSQTQQRLMGQIYGVRKFMDTGGKQGLDPKDVNPKYRSMIAQKAKEWKGEKSLKAYASTKHKGLPEEVVKESFDPNKLSFLVGKPISLTKTLHTTGKYDPETGAMPKVQRDESINGIIKGFDDEEGFSVPYMVISTTDGNKILGHVIWDKKTKEFVEGNSSYHYVYTPQDEKSARNLELFKVNFYEEVQESEIPTIYPYLEPDSKKSRKKSPHAKLQNLVDYREYIKNIKNNG
jgi:hypothetical protein